MSDKIDKKSWENTLTELGYEKTRNILLIEGFTSNEVDTVMRSCDPESDIRKIFSYHQAKVELLLGKIFRNQIEIADIAKIS